MSTRPEYHFEIEGDAVTEEQDAALDQAEVFLCRRPHGTYLVLRDVFGQGRMMKMISKSPIRIKPNEKRYTEF